MTNHFLLKSLQALQQIQWTIHQMVQGTGPQFTSEPVHKFHPSDLGWVRKVPSWTLKPIWKGPYPVVLTTPIEVKVTGISPWIHYTPLKETTEEGER